MGLTSWIIPSVALCLLSLVPPLGLATAHASPLQSSAQRVTVEGRSITYGLKDDHSQVVKAVVPAQARTDIQRQSADATVQATRASVDWATNRVKVVTTPSERRSDALPHAGVERILLGNMVAQGDTMAEEMTCSKDDGTHCILAKDTHGNEVEVQVSAVKAGEKLTCTEKRDHIHCQKDLRKLQHDAMQKQ